jgi:uncharacterized cysteine cluster protein YcgN (CxxCxxCC family)
MLGKPDACGIAVETGGQPLASWVRCHLEGTAASIINPPDVMTAPPKPLSDQERFFWKTKTLEEMSNAEWESLCDGCGRCCLEKLEEEETGKIYFTHVSCKLLDAGLCACKDYPNRSDKVPDCVRLTPENVRTLTWLPPSCGYRLVADGRDLYWWHPLLSGDPDTVHKAGVSVRGRVQGTEDDIPDAELEHHIVQWPKMLPKRARVKPTPKA